MHRGDEIIYIEIRIGKGGYGFCVRRLVRSNFAPEIEYQKIITPIPSTPDHRPLTSTIAFL